MPSKIKIVSYKAHNTQLDKLRRKTTIAQRQLLNIFWQYYQIDAKWPTARLIHSQFGGKQSVKSAIQALGGDIVFEAGGNQDGNRYHLTIIGVLLTEDGEKYRILLVNYLSFLREQFQSQPEKLDFTDKDFVQALKLSEAESRILSALINLSRLSAGWGGGSQSWNIRPPSEIEDLPEKGQLDEALDTLLFRHFEPSKPVFYEDRQNQNAIISPYSNLPEFSSLESSRKPNYLHIANTIDPFKRRYQVFVSSTYEDLKEERHHVIQALLETKCIPTGMELFPAASVEQWELIQKVIDECDYYLVIVAGRYGSLNKMGVGYTEQEFDYAIQIGKPVIGFYHKDLDEIPNSKSEKTDAGRKLLKIFTEKVKQRVCRPWSSAAELGSAVKSAIINELEFNPKPGWVRADAVPPSDAMEKLKQRIADLEEKSKRRQKNQPKSTLPSGKQVTEMSVLIKYDYEKYTDEFEFESTRPTKKTPQKVMLTWDEIVLILAERLQTGIKFQEISSLLNSEIENRLIPAMSKLVGSEKPDFECDLDEENLDIVLKTLMARKLIKVTYTKFGRSYAEWQFTSKGLQYLSELQAIRSRK